MLDLLALAMVNVCTALILYFFFSLRTSRVLEQSRQDPLSPQLKENIELTIQYINSSLKLFDQKKKACYQMLLQAENILKDISKKIPAPQSKQGQSKKASKAKLKKNLRKKAEQSKTSYVASPLKPRADYDAQQALDKLGEDKAEITQLVPQAKDAYLLGASREHQELLSLSLSMEKIAPAPLAKRFKLRMLSQKLGQRLAYWLKASPSLALKETILDPQKEANHDANRAVPREQRETEDLAPVSPQFSSTLAKKTDIQLPVELPQRVKAVHELIEQGYTKQEVSFATRLSLAQVNLLAALPQAEQGPSPKRL